MFRPMGLPPTCATTSQRALTALALQVGGAARAVALDRGATLFDLVATVALDQRDLKL